jgi:AraC family transcriptional regulator
MYLSRAAKMFSDDFKAIARAHGISPVFAHTNVADSGIAVGRWQKDRERHSNLVEICLPSYCISLALRPMWVTGWYGDDQFFSGRVEANSFRITPPRSSLRWQCSSAYDVVLLAFHEPVLQSISGLSAPHLLQRLALLASPNSSHGPSYIRDDVSANIGRQLAASMSDTSQYTIKFIEGVSYGLISRLLGRFSDSCNQPLNGGLSPSVLRRVRTHITENLSEKLRVADLAKVAGMSTSHFAHAFSDAVGVSPYRFINETRIQMAETLLHDDHRSILNIALDCGFKDSSHFARVFRTILGVTPRAYRFSTRNGAH